MSMLDPRLNPFERFIREANPRSVSAPTAFERGIVRADPSTVGMMDLRNAAQDAAITAVRAADRNMEVLPGNDLFNSTPTDFSRIRDDQGRINPIWTYLADMGRSDLLETQGELFQRIAELAAEGRPIAPADLELATLSEEDAEAFRNAINQYNEQLEEGEEVVDITQDDTTIAADSELADTTTTEEAEPIPDYSEFVNPESAPVTTIPGVGSVGTGTTTSTPTTPMTPPPGSAGVIVDIEDLMNAGDWTVFLPGVIPGLPSSPTILGTIEEILNNPSGIFDDLLEDLEGIVTNPEQVLEDILNDAADSDGLITIGGIQSVISDIMDRIEEGPEAPPATIATEQDPTIIGGAEDEEEEVAESTVQETTTEEPDVTTEPPAVAEEVTTEPPAVAEEVTTEPPAVAEEVTTEPPAVAEEVTTEPPAVADTSQPETTAGGGATTDSPEPQPEVGGEEDTDSAGGGGGMFTGGTSQVGVPIGGLTLQQAQMILPPRIDAMSALDGLLSELYKETDKAYL